MTHVLIQFLHVVGALGIAAAYAVELAGLVGLRRSTAGDEARAWLRTRRWVLMLGPPSIGLVLATGIYTIVVGWGLVGWIRVSLGSLVALALIGGVLTGVPMARIGPRVERTVGPLPQELRQEIRSRVLTISVAIRLALTVGVVLLMVAKPDTPTSVMVVALAAAIGATAGWAVASREPIAAKP